MAVEKRKAELATRGSTCGRKVLGLYTLALLTRIETVVTSGAVLTYALQFLTDRTNINRDSDIGKRPEEILLTDRPLQLTVAAWAITIIFILALKHAQVVS